jgi:4-methylaminobutanoate oxidase (formaldehyde-forming)
LREQAPLNRRLVQLKLDDPNVLCHHEEPIVVNGDMVGSVTSGMYGYRVDASLAMGYIELPDPITNDSLAAAKIEIEVADQRLAVQAQLGPWYDPKMARVKA